MSSTPNRRLFDLLPAIYRQRDEEIQGPLLALLSIIGDQVDVVEQDIRQLYDNWFIETCQDWVVPYIGDLIGYQEVHEAGEPGDISNLEGRLRNKILTPRREVANTIRNRRRKGTLAVLEALVQETAGWPSRVVQAYQLLGWTQPVNWPHTHRGRTLDVRDSHALELLNTPFARTGRTVDLRDANIPSVDLFVWRLKSYSVTRTQALSVDDHPNGYTFSILGNDTPLFTYPLNDPHSHPTDREIELPVPIRRRAFEVRDEHGNNHANPDYYGPNRSMLVTIGEGKNAKTFGPEEVIPADLHRWHYEVPAGKIAIDPERGRIAFPDEVEGSVWVHYQYGLSADIGGGEYARQVTEPTGATILKVGAISIPNETVYETIGDALKAANNIPNAVIEIVDSRLYEETIRIVLPDEAKLQIRAARGKRPVIRIRDISTAQDALRITLGAGSRFVLDGLLVVGRAVYIVGHGTEDNRPSVLIRHCTLVPGWTIDEHCCPKEADKPSLRLRDTSARICIEHSILGSIEVWQDEARTDAIRIGISDSILDGTSQNLDALGSQHGCGMAYAALTITRTTVIGHVHTHRIDLAEDCIFWGNVQVARRQIGCIRFCYVPLNSRTPPRYECQPVDEASAIRVRPRFNSTRYGTPGYCQLARDCPTEISAGASDESEMGAFHDLFQPQRAANLRKRLQEYVPASADVSITYAT